MSKQSAKTRVVIVDDVLEEAQETAHRLSRLPPDLLNSRELGIEIANDAYFVANRVCNSTDQSPWDVIIADVFMPKPVGRKCPTDEDPKPKTSERQYRGRTYKTWESDLGANDPHPDHGGFLIAQRLREMRRKSSVDVPKLVLVSSRLLGPDRQRLLQLQPSERAWFQYHDKTCWDKETADWPRTLLRPDIFVWSLLHAIRLLERPGWVTPMPSDPEQLVGNSPLIQTLLTRARKLATKPAAGKPSPILITGPPGTGKTTLARAMHAMRFDPKAEGRPFVRVDLITLPETLFESELFGHAKGAFGGAYTARKGIVHDSNGGSLFLDEIGDVPIPCQGKLLSLLCEGVYRPVGTNKSEECQAELIISATNRNLADERLFRPDLKDRVNGNWLDVPPLSRHAEDILPLAESALRQFNTTHQRQQPLTLSDKAKQWLQLQQWPGNARELMKCVEAAADDCLGSQITDGDFVRQASEYTSSVPVGDDSTQLKQKAVSQQPNATADEVLAALDHACGNRTRAACALRHLGENATDREKDNARAWLAALLRHLKSADPDLYAKLPQPNPRGGRPRR